MANGSKHIEIKPTVDNAVSLKLNGVVFSAQSNELSGSLNALIAYWNTILGRNIASDKTCKLSATTSEKLDSAVRAMKDLPKGKGGR